METKFTHFDEQGNAVMVDVSEKNPTSRTALAEGKIQVNREVMDAILHHTVKKGDVLGVARVAGIMAVKQTSSLIRCAMYFQSVNAVWILRLKKKILRLKPYVW